jgi:hypothetical protein
METSGEAPPKPDHFAEASSQPKFPIDFQMDGSDDKHDEAMLKLNEDGFRELQKINSI